MSTPAKKKIPTPNDGLLARKAAWQALHSWTKGEGFIAEILNRNTELEDPADRGLAMEIALGVCRRQKYLEWAVGHFCRRKPQRKLMLVLNIALYQLKYLERIPEYAVVHTAVALARKVEDRKAGAFVNGVLRSVLREGIPKEPGGSSSKALSIKYSHPKWLIEKWLSEFDIDDTIARLEHDQQEPPFWLRINPAKTTPLELSERWGWAVQGAVFGRYLRVEGSLSKVLKTPEWEQGYFSVQDPASYLVCALLDVQENHKVLDLCGAPGGKTALLLENTQDKALVTTCDIEESRLASLQDVKDRLGYKNFTTQVVDGENPPSDFTQYFDRVLVDAPCSNLGVLARRPELRERIRPDMLKEIAAKQMRILEGAASTVKPGGTLVYATCSPEQEETLQVVQQFLAKHPEFSSDPDAPEFMQDIVQEGQLRLIPGLDPFDGFFAAKLIRQEEKEV
jgi:16S rRNA (cytosine967-C5)-methyltransferase